MNVLVVADSAYGNTYELATAIGDALALHARVIRVEKLAPVDLEGVELLIVGSPTQGGRPTAAMKQFLVTLTKERLRNTGVAAFDTRIDPRSQGFALRLLMGAIGYAAPKIARDLVARGGRLLVPPEGFIVTGKEGPLKDGERERAMEWARRLHSVAGGG